MFNKEHSFAKLLQSTDHEKKPPHFVKNISTVPSTRTIHRTMEKF
jgi:hypothetical protein